VLLDSTLIIRICSWSKLSSTQHKLSWTCNTWTTKWTRCSSTTRIIQIHHHHCSRLLLLLSICQLPLQMERPLIKMKLKEEMKTLNTFKDHIWGLGRAKMFSMKIKVLLQELITQNQSIKRQLGIWQPNKVWQHNLLHLMYWESILILVSLRGRSLIS
jgi:hypothetical protein